MPEMTESELHAIMTGGFATIAGSVFGIYISFGKTEEVKVPCFVYLVLHDISTNLTDSLTF
jgi:CNT family concentrative nucleoside transporter